MLSHRIPCPLSLCFAFPLGDEGTTSGSQSPVAQPSGQSPGSRLKLDPIVFSIDWPITVVISLQLCLFVTLRSPGWCHAQLFMRQVLSSTESLFQNNPFLVMGLQFTQQQESPGLVQGSSDIPINVWVFPLLCFPGSYQVSGFLYSCCILVSSLFASES